MPALPAYNTLGATIKAGERQKIKNINAQRSTNFWADEYYVLRVVYFLCVVHFNIRQ